MTRTFLSCQFESVDRRRDYIATCSPVLARQSSNRTGGAQTMCCFFLTRLKLSQAQFPIETPLKHYVRLSLTIYLIGLAHFLSFIVRKAGLVKAASIFMGEKKKIENHVRKLKACDVFLDTSFANKGVIIHPQTPPMRSPEKTGKKKSKKSMQVKLKALGEYARMWPLPGMPDGACGLRG